MCSFRTLSCGNIVHEQILSEQRIRKKEANYGFFFSAVRALACEGLRNEPHITATALLHYCTIAHTVLQFKQRIQ